MVRGSKRTELEEDMMCGSEERCSVVFEGGCD